MAPDRLVDDFVCSFLLLALAFPGPSGLYYVDARYVLDHRYIHPLQFLFRCWLPSLALEQQLDGSIQLVLHRDCPVVLETYI